MKIAIIGYGKEGKANEAYFRQHDLEGRKLDEGEQTNEIEIISPYQDADYEKYDFGQYDLVLRSPSVRPRPGFSSGTQFFFDHCPVPIIGVTGTKGKGTTCSMMRNLLEALGYKVWLLGNIGIPAIEKLDEIRETVADEKGNNGVAKDRGEKVDYIDKNGKYCVIYELSSFQLWDLTKSPNIAVVLRIAPDHLNVHKDFEEYVAAKGRICEFQGTGDSVVYFGHNKGSRKIAARSKGRKIAYPVEIEQKKAVYQVMEASGEERTEPDEARQNEFYRQLRHILRALKVPGLHNQENAQAALFAVAEFLGVAVEELIAEYGEELRQALANFRSLPHHIELVRKLRGVNYYDDSFSTSEPSLEVALKAFQGRPLVLIAGGQDKGVDLSEVKRMIFGAEGLLKVFLLGEIAEKIAAGEDPAKVEIVDSLAEAVAGAQKVAEADGGKAVVLLSPGAASLDMFENYYVRGEEFQRLVRGLE